MLATRYEDEINASFLPSESLWLAVEPLLPEMKSRTGEKGRPPKSNRQMFFAMFYLLRAGGRSTRCSDRAFIALRISGLPYPSSRIHQQSRKRARARWF